MRPATPAACAAAVSQKGNEGIAMTLTREGHRVPLVTENGDGKARDHRIPGQGPGTMA